MITLTDIVNYLINLFWTYSLFIWVMVIFAIVAYLRDECDKLKVGDIVYWQPKDIKCMIIDKRGDRFYICDMSGKELFAKNIDDVYSVHRGTLTKRRRNYNV